MSELPDVASSSGAFSERAVRRVKLRVNSALPKSTDFGLGVQRASARLPLCVVRLGDEAAACGEISIGDSLLSVDGRSVPTDPRKSGGLVSQQLTRAHEAGRDVTLEIVSLPAKSTADVSANLWLSLRDSIDVETTPTVAAIVESDRLNSVDSIMSYILSKTTEKPPFVELRISGWHLMHGRGGRGGAKAKTSVDFTYSIAVPNVRSSNAIFPQVSSSHRIQSTEEVIEAYLSASCGARELIVRNTLSWDGPWLAHKVRHLLRSEYTGQLDVSLFFSGGQIRVRPDSVTGHCIHTNSCCRTLLWFPLCCVAPVCVAPSVFELEHRFEVSPDVGSFFESHVLPKLYYVRAGVKTFIKKD